MTTIAFTRPREEWIKSCKHAWKSRRNAEANKMRGCSSDDGAHDKSNGHADASGDILSQCTTALARGRRWRSTACASCGRAWGAGRVRSRVSWTKSLDFKGLGRGVDLLRNKREHQQGTSENGERTDVSVIEWVRELNSVPSRGGLRRLLLGNRLGTIVILLDSYDGNGLNEDRGIRVGETSHIRKFNLHEKWKLGWLTE